MWTCCQSVVPHSTPFWLIQNQRGFQVPVLPALELTVTTWPPNDLNRRQNTYELNECTALNSFHSNSNSVRPLPNLFSLSFVERSFLCHCSHCGWLLLKCSAIGIGFNGVETNCRIAHILGILLMNSCNTDKFLATTIICSLSALNTPKGAFDNKNKCNNLQICFWR